MRHLTLAEVLYIHESVLAQTGGRTGIRDLAALESAISQPKASVGGADAYPTLVEKASALAYSLCSNHPFIDGNKRVAHAAMETFLVLNGYEIQAPVEEQERVMLGVASGAVGRGEKDSNAAGDWLQRGFELGDTGIAAFSSRCVAFSQVSMSLWDASSQVVTTARLMGD